jgi:hypothetical protein
MVARDIKKTITAGLGNVRNFVCSGQTKKWGISWDILSGTQPFQPLNNNKSNIPHF